MYFSYCVLFIYLFCCVRLLFEFSYHFCLSDLIFIDFLNYFFVIFVVVVSLSFLLLSIFLFLPFNFPNCEGLTYLYFEFPKRKKWIVVHVLCDSTSSKLWSPILPLSLHYNEKACWLAWSHGHLKDPILFSLPWFFLASSRYFQSGNKESSGIQSSKKLSTCRTIRTGSADHHVEHKGQYQGNLPSSDDVLLLVSSSHALDGLEFV